MAFNTYKKISSVLKKFQITYQEDRFMLTTPIELSDYFKAELAFRDLQ